MSSEPRHRLWIRVSGEFIVIVAGVLAAFAVEDWSSERADRRAETEYLTALAVDLRFDSAFVGSRLVPSMEITRSLLESIAPVARGESPFPVDTVGFLRDVATSIPTPIFDAGQATYDELVSTGSLRLIESSTLRAAIVNFYNQVALASTINQASATGYRAAVLSDLPARGPRVSQPLGEQDWESTLRSFGVRSAAEAVTRPGFAAALNRHLNYWVVAGSWLESRFQGETALLALIDAEIDRLR